MSKLTRFGAKLDQVIRFASDPNRRTDYLSRATLGLPTATSNAADPEYRAQAQAEASRHVLGTSLAHTAIGAGLGGAIPGGLALLAMKKGLHPKIVRGAVKGIRHLEKRGKGAAADVVRDVLKEKLDRHAVGTIAGLGALSGAAAGSISGSLQGTYGKKATDIYNKYRKRDED